MFTQLDITGIQTNSILQRQNKVALKDCATPFDIGNGSFSAFLDSLPSILKVNDLRHLVSHVIASREQGKPIILLIGAHVIKVGLAPVLIDLMEHGLVTVVAMNSAAAIHDSESALFGVTSEDVAVNLLDGSFGMWKETGDFINGTLVDAFHTSEIGYGEALGQALVASQAPHLEYSVLAAGIRLGIPVTVHAAIGTDIVHQQPSMDGAATGALSFRDFKVLANSVKDLQGGGVVLNIGSAVILPEIFLKVLTVVRNLGYPASGFVTANFDMIQHYRPNMNVVSRPTQDGGTGYTFTGHHEIMIPLLAAMLRIQMMKEESHD